MPPGVGGGFCPYWGAKNPGLASRVTRPLSHGSVHSFACGLHGTVNIRSGPCFPVVEFLRLLLPRLSRGFRLRVCSRRRVKSTRNLACPRRRIVHLQHSMCSNTYSDGKHSHFAITRRIKRCFLRAPTEVILTGLRRNADMPRCVGPR